MRFYRIAGYVAAFLVLLVAALVTWVVLTDEEFASVDFLEPHLWEETPEGYIATLANERDGMVCVCGGYQCPRDFQSPTTKVEPTHLAFEGWLRPRYSIIKDPEAGEDPYWGRRVHGEESCVKRKKGETFTLYLNRSIENDWLKLSIE